MLRRLVVSCLIAATGIVASHQVTHASNEVAPRIVSIVSTKRGQRFDLKISMTHGKSGTASVTLRSWVTSSAGSCSVVLSRKSCVIKNVRSGQVLTIKVDSRMKNSTRIYGQAVKYRVGATDWTAKEILVRPSSFSGRTYGVYSPTALTAQKLPLVVVLHGHASSGEQQATYMGLQSAAEKLKFHLVMPDGIKNPREERFWNAGSICCDYFNSGINDEQFLIDLVAYSISSLKADSSRVYLIGHSNGGAMAYRLTCHHPEKFAGVVSLAGIGQYEASQCSQVSSVSSLHIHGTNDEVTLFQGGLRNGLPYVGARDMAERTRSLNRCSTVARENVRSVDIARDVPGDESQVTVWDSCAQDVSTEMWTIVNGSHIPALSSSFSTAVYEFLSRHRK